MTLSRSRPLSRLKVYLGAAHCYDPYTQHLTINSGGGADGSIAIFARTETAFHANIGLDEVVETQRPFLERSGMGVADLCVTSVTGTPTVLRQSSYSIQFAGAVAVTNCPGAPPLNVSIGMFYMTIGVELDADFSLGRIDGKHKPSLLCFDYSIRLQATRPAPDGLVPEPFGQLYYRAIPEIALNRIGRLCRQDIGSLQ